MERRDGSREGYREDSRNQSPEEGLKTIFNGLALDPEKVRSPLKRGLSQRGT